MAESPDSRAAAWQEHILAVWDKGRVIKGYKSNEWRHDAYGNVIRFADYGNRDSKYGWEIDHITAVADGGSDALSNLRPLQWEANVRRN